LTEQESTTTAGGVALRLEDVAVSLNGTVLVALTETIAPGDVLTVMGASGAGKSTLLAYVAGFLDPAFEARGQVRFDNAPDDLTELPPEARRIGLLFQDPLLLPHLSVGGNLAFGMPSDVSDRRARGEEALASAGLDGFYDRDVATLSGGQKARVALVRLLLSEPRAVLLDEPFSKLDAELRDDIRSLVFGRLRAAGLPSILVTHDAVDAEAAGGRIIHLGKQSDA